MNGPLIVQSDKTLLLEVDHELAGAARRAIAPFAELERAPEHIHTYRITPLGLWNARAAYHDAEQVVDALVEYSRYPVPHALLVDVAETMARYGRLTLSKHPVHGLVLTSTDRPVLEEILRSKKVAPLVGARLDADTVAVHPSERGQIKQTLLKLGWPAEDLMRLRGRRGAPDRPGRGRLGAAAVPAAGRRGLLARRLRCGRTALRRRRRRWSAPGPWRWPRRRR